jgi:hypothetical protein
MDAGCPFQSGDLPVSLWEALAHLKIERNRFEGLVMEQRTERAKADAAIRKAQNEARKLDKIPPPGQSLFGGSKR